MYTMRVPRPRVLRPRHSVVTQWDVLLPLGIAPPNPETDATEMPANPAAAAAVDRRLAAAGIGAATPIVVVHVSAGNPFRRWPAASFVDLVCRLVAADPRRRIMLTSGPSDAGPRRRIASRAARVSRCKSGPIVRCGEFDLGGVRALVGRSALYIGGDSGPLHVAGTTGVPVVGLYGPTLPVRSQPIEARSSSSAAAEVHGLACRPCDQRQCVPGDFRCLTGISADDGGTLAERALGSGAG